MPRTPRRLSQPLRAAAGLQRVDGQSAPDQRAADRPHSSYWAFISYASSDQQWAHALRRRLEAYRIPRDARPATAAAIPSTRRLRPVFRDDDELAASANLGGRLREALDRSRYLIVVASPAAAASRWVNAEVRHFLDAGRADDILVVVVDGEPGGAPEREALPAALQGLADEPLWVDARGTAKPERKTFLRLAAGMLGVRFDALWQRDRRHRRRRLATWTAATLLVTGMVGAVIWQQQRIAEEDQPQRQVAAFRQFLVADILKTSRESDPGFKESDVLVDIVRTDDLNGDSLIDFFAFNRTVTFCGSGGCAMGVYLSQGRGSYREVLDLFGSSTPRTRNAKSGTYKEIVASHYAIDSEPIYTVFRWTGQEYALSHYEFCDGVWLEYCEPPLVIKPIDRAVSQRLTITPGAAYRQKPKTSTSRIEQSGSNSAVIGEVAGGDWYLVEVWKGQSGFVSRRDVSAS